MVASIAVAASLISGGLGQVTVGSVNLSADFGSKVGLAVIAGAIGLLSGYVLDHFKARREPRKELSWDAHVQHARISVTPYVRDNLRILYQQSPAEHIASIDCKISNTGNRVVKDTTVRFAVPVGCEILDAVLVPLPEPELDVIEAPGHTDRRREKQYRVGHLEVGQEVRFRLVVNGSDADNWEIHSHNAEGDLTFKKREVTRRTVDREHVVPFVVIATLLLVVPGALSSAGSLFLPSGVAASVTALILFGFLTPHILPVARTVDALVALVLLPANNDKMMRVEVHSNDIEGGLTIAGHDVRKYGGSGETN